MSEESKSASAFGRWGPGVAIAFGVLTTLSAGGAIVSRYLRDLAEGDVEGAEARLNAFIISATIAVPIILLGVLSLFLIFSIGWLRSIRLASLHPGTVVLTARSVSVTILETGSVLPLRDISLGLVAGERGVELWTGLRDLRLVRYLPRAEIVEVESMHYVDPADKFGRPVQGEGIRIATATTVVSFLLANPRPFGLWPRKRKAVQQDLRRLHDALGGVNLVD